ncbi:ATP-grasp domain-containing protein [Desulfuromonas sp. CSMB_57]|uniref:ATP-grasp domain-containing protein n=1 Tax=Desulfuromonas sp. CSMB_57 TaxID=2807629 RepID=UPI001CD747D0|nr:ATP-grasp domain-containing protein [Desulfuromonas sp. CSMB_57]
MFNVLLTSAGRRNYLVQYFREALAGQGSVFAADASGAASAMQEADRGFVVPPVTDPFYIPTVLTLCREHQVRLLLSLNDLELPVLAAHRDLFQKQGTFPVVSTPEVIEICFDKWLTVQFLEKCGLQAPKTYLHLDELRCALDEGRVEFPLVVKPRWGSASVGIEYPSNWKELELILELTQMRIAVTGGAEASAQSSLLIQERLRGSEYGLDVVNDFNGRHVATFAKRKLAMRAGETDRAITVTEPELLAVGEKIGTNLGHIGNLDCDVFFDGQQWKILELNPRFGGGYPFTHMAGVNLPALLIAWAQGLDLDPAWLQVKNNVASAKCDRLVKIQSVFTGH